MPVTTRGDDIPRWARKLKGKMWTRICELLDDGHPPADIARQVKLPDEKLRSLYLYARKHGPRRRLTRFAEFKNALLRNVEQFGGEFARALTMIAERAVDPDEKSTTQLRAIEAMTNYAKMLQAMMAGDAREAGEVDVRVEVSEKGKRLSDEAIREIKAVYGIRDDHGDGNG